MRIKPFANLVRLDLRDRPLVFLQGAVYVTETGSRRDSGTAYTTKELADEVAEHALAPLCYSPGPQHTPDTNQWRIRPATDILDLKVCDPAVGSGAILVAACRYLAERLIEAWRAERDPRGAETATAADDPNRLDVVIEARRLVAEHCCYGVDRNPMAVEMAKLSMWLTTVARNRPFTFLDHALKAGDSLLGIWNLDQLRHLHYDAAAGRARATPIPGFSARRRRATRRRAARRPGIANTARDAQHRDDPPRRRRTQAEAPRCQREASDDPGDDRRRRCRRSFEHRRRTRRRAQHSPPEWKPMPKSSFISSTPSRRQEKLKPCTVPAIRARLRLDAGRPDGAPSRHPLHWPIAFPEVFTDDGDSRAQFRCDGGQSAVHRRPENHRRGRDGLSQSCASTWIAGGTRGVGRSRGVFLPERHQDRLSPSAIWPPTPSRKATPAKSASPRFIDMGWKIHRAVSSTTWPGQATLEIAKVWATAHPWSGQHVLDGRPVAGIDEMLYPLSRSRWRKQRLAENTDKSFIGSYVLGTEGFTMSPEEAQALIDKDPNNADVLRPYLGGKDLNQSPTQTAPRWIINFFDWPEEKARQYPDCFSIVEEEVKPMRQERKANGDFKKRKPLPELYWIYAEKRPKLYRTIAPLERVLAISRVSKTVQPVFVPIGQVLSEETVVFAYVDDFHFGVLTCGFHFRWAMRFASSMRTDTRYTPSDVFETFPQPPHDDAVAVAGKALDDCRLKLMVERELGLTDVYNLIHDPNGRSDERIQQLRDLHVGLDVAVRDAYGWSDLVLGHGFRDVRGQGVRFTFSPEAGDEVLDRLLELNKERYDAEVAAGLHKPAKKPKARKANPAGQGSLLGADQ